MKHFIIRFLIFITFTSLSYSAEAPSQQIGDRLLKKEIERINKKYEKELAGLEWMKNSENKEKREFYSIAVKNTEKVKEHLIREVQELYPWYEMRIDHFKQQLPKYEIGGNLTYFMSLQEMINTVKAKFKDMYRKGQIMTKQEFEKQDKNKWYFKSTGLTRIWGAEYLAKKFQENNITGIKVPHYIIVVDDPHKIQVSLEMTDECFPVVAHIRNGEIYAEKIEGKEIAQKSMSLIGFGYTDYSTPGNIIKNKEGIYYPVDTEYKSFYDGMPQEPLFKNMDFEKGTYHSMCSYFYKRFRSFNPIERGEKAIQFSVID